MQHGMTTIVDATSSTEESAYPHIEKNVKRDALNVIESSYDKVGENSMYGVWRALGPNCAEENHSEIGKQQNVVLKKLHSFVKMQIVKVRLRK